MAPRPIPIRVSDSDASALRDLVARGGEIGARANIILMLARGERGTDVAEKLSVDRAFVSQWRRRYAEGGVEAIASEGSSWQEKPLEVKASDLPALKHLAKDANLHIATRAQIVLMSAEGVPVRDIAEKLGVVSQFVSKWRRRYREHGIGVLTKYAPEE